VPSALALVVASFFRLRSGLRQCGCAFRRGGYRTAKAARL